MSTLTKTTAGSLASQGNPDLAHTCVSSPSTARRQGLEGKQEGPGNIQRKALLPTVCRGLVWLVCRLRLALSVCRERRRGVSRPAHARVLRLLPLPPSVPATHNATGRRSMKELEERAKITTTKAHRRKGIRVCRPVPGRGGVRGLDASTSRSREQAGERNDHDERLSACGLSSYSVG